LALAITSAGRSLVVIPLTNFPSSCAIVSIFYVPSIYRGGAEVAEKIK
jgi:hypothetical protein